jgi:hypothetical protein
LAALIVPVTSKLDAVIPLTFKLPLDTFVETTLDNVLVAELRLVVVMFVVSTLLVVIPVTFKLPDDKLVIIPLVTFRVALLWLVVLRFVVVPVLEYKLEELTVVATSVPVLILLETTFVLVLEVNCIVLEEIFVNTTFKPVLDVN